MSHSRATFSSSELPNNLDDRARYLLWRDLFVERYGPSFDLAKADDRQFAMRCDFARFGGVEVGRFDGTVIRFSRTHRHPADQNDDFVLGVNGGNSRMSYRQLNREGIIAPGEAVLVTNTEAGEIHSRADNQWYALSIPRRQLTDLVGNVEGALGVPVSFQHALLRHLQRYLKFLLESDVTCDADTLADYISTTLLDLVTLLFSSSRETLEMSSARGLRAARLHDAISNIKANFSDPAFSARTVGRNLNLSTRYVQELLQETGTSFTQRINELRLQKARDMLTDPRFNRLKISDIALTCGFKEASYFNRRFRARFGCSPMQYRNGPL